jgi:L-histidine Nalpha-methyltransferase
MTNSSLAGRRAVILAEVREGLARRPRELSPKYFYDERGSELFEAITALPEYYLTRAERSILEARANEIAMMTGARSLVELGAGSAAKTRVLLDAFERIGQPFTYIPVDVSEAFLEQTREALEREYPRLRVDAVVADIGESIDLPIDVDRPALFAFLGSTIGNFDAAAAVQLLHRIRREMRPGDGLLLGTDLIKDVGALHAAYNDSAGITAEFNRNMLRVLNAELGADFVPDRFEHRAFYNAKERRIEMHLHSIGDQVVRIPGIDPLILRDGESIRTELSHKYDRGMVDDLAQSAGLGLERWFTDDAGRFALSLLAPAA